MKKRDPYANLLLLLLALCVLGTTVAEFIGYKSDAPATCQEDFEERFEEELEEHLDVQICWAAFEPLQEAFSYGQDLQFLIFISPRTIASSRSLGWSMPLRI